MKGATLGSWGSAKTSRWGDIKVCIMTSSKFRTRIWYKNIMTSMNCTL